MISFLYLNADDIKLKYNKNEAQNAEVKYLFYYLLISIINMRYKHVCAMPCLLPDVSLSSFFILLSFKFAQVMSVTACSSAHFSTRYVKSDHKNGQVAHFTAQQTWHDKNKMKIKLKSWALLASRIALYDVLDVVEKLL